jgi:thiol-disulfide isomerase/thioredoxin
MNKELHHKQLFKALTKNNVMKFSTTLLLLFMLSIGYGQELTIVEQDFDKARELAKKENKLLLIDFYTTWCRPCKKLDKLIFQNDSISREIGKEFILLRYDAEDDTVFNLSKKHHVSSYPTGIVLDGNGYVLNKKYGFSGEDVKELSEEYLKFTNESIDLNRQKKILNGYSNSIDITKYPRFYIDYINKNDKHVTSRTDFKEYWDKEHDILSEEYFSTVVYFCTDVPVSVSDNFLENKDNYIERYGEKDVNFALELMSFVRFKESIENKSQQKFDEAVTFIKKALSDETANQMVAMFTKKFEESKKE